MLRYMVWGLFGVVSALLTNVATADQMSSLAAAVKAGDIGQVRSLLAAEPSFVRVPDQNSGITLLHVAADYGHADVGELLIAKGADVNAKSKDGVTPLSGAVSKDRKAIAELLLTKGADVNAKDKHGSTPLHSATFNGYKTMAELLLAKGANVNAKAEDGSTPLRLAVNLPQQPVGKDIVELLRKHGAKEG